MEIVAIIVVVIMLGLIMDALRCVIFSGRKMHYYYGSTHSSEEKGANAEKFVMNRIIDTGISEKAIFHNLYVRKHNNHFSQIDLVVATRVGMLVFEVKNYSGWIFGNGRQQQWTQVLNYGQEKHRFYNPILQNKKHIDDLRARLGHLGDFPFYSIIVFCGDCELRDVNFVPAGTFITTGRRVSHVINTILNENDNALLLR